MLDYTHADQNPTPQKVNIAVLTTMWRRQVLTEFTFKWFNHAQKELLKKGVGLYLFAVGSEGEYSRTIALRHNYNYMERPNFPVSAKRNQALEKIRDWEVEMDAVLFVDTDDLLPVDLIALYANFISQGYPYMGMQDIYFFDASTRKMIYFSYPKEHSNHGVTLGLGRCVSRALLNRAGWKLWPDDINRNMDINMTRKLLPLLKDFPKGERKVLCKTFNFLPLDIKTQTNIWSFDKYTSKLGTYDFVSDPKKALNKAYGKRTADSLYSLQIETQILPEWS